MNLTRFAIDAAIEKTKSKSKYKDTTFDTDELIVIYLMMYKLIEKKKYYNPWKKIWMKAAQFEILEIIKELKQIPNN
jgi:hypothetical protein